MFNLALTGNQILIGIIALVLVILGVVFFMRSRYRKRSIDGITYAKDRDGFDLDSFNQYPGANAFRNTGTIFLFGIASALLIINLACSWTNYEDEIVVPEGYFDIEDEIEMEPPRTAKPPPPPPPPPPPVIEEVPEEEIEEVVEFESQDAFEDTPVEAPPAPEPVKEAAPPPPPPPPPPPKEEEIFQVVEDNPRFPGCEDEPSKDKREQCALGKLYEYIQDNLQYPAIARENNIEGKVFVQFVVNSKGKVDKIKLLRGQNQALDNEAIRVIEKMSKDVTWIPGKQRGNPVSVYYRLPITFKLQ